MTIDDAWGRPGNQGGNSAVYLSINNPTDHRDELITAETDIAESVEIHLSRMDDESMMVMEHQDIVEIPPRTSVIFQPGGLHIMLISIREELVIGDQFKLTLNFREAESIQIDVVIQEP